MKLVAREDNYLASSIRTFFIKDSRGPSLFLAFSTSARGCEKRDGPASFQVQGFRVSRATVQGGEDACARGVMASSYSTAYTTFPLPSSSHLQLVEVPRLTYVSAVFARRLLS
eukprot:scaffold41451_cov28-Tisochrysis_lutea.AAC.2